MAEIKLCNIKLNIRHLSEEKPTTWFYFPYADIGLKLSRYIRYYDVPYDYTIGKISILEDIRNVYKPFTILKTAIKKPIILKSLWNPPKRVPVLFNYTYNVLIFFSEYRYSGRDYLEHKTTITVTGEEYKFTNKLLNTFVEAVNSSNLDL